MEGGEVLTPDEIFTAARLIEVYGDRAAHVARKMWHEAVRKGDRPLARQLLLAYSDLLERGLGEPTKQVLEKSA